MKSYVMVKNSNGQVEPREFTEFMNARQGQPVRTTPAPVTTKIVGYNYKLPNDTVILRRPNDNKHVVFHPSKGQIITQSVLSEAVNQSAVASTAAESVISQQQSTQTNPTTTTIYDSAT